jgi:hypothetical protein
MPPGPSKNGSESIRMIEGIGSQAAEVFERAGAYTVLQLKHLDIKDLDSRLRAAVDAVRNRPPKSKLPALLEMMPADYWDRLFRRCLSVAYRVRSAEAADFVPAEYMCPLSLDWFEDPVVTPDGQSYSRRAIEEYLRKLQRSAESLAGPAGPAGPACNGGGSNEPLYDNLALRAAVEHYRLHQLRFRIQNL